YSGGHYITLSLNGVRDPKKMRKVIVHEMYHAVSGETIVLEGDDDYEVKNQRTGTHFRPGVSRKSKNPVRSRFRWLNEGITERLTQQHIHFSGEQAAYETYVVEQQLIDHLMSEAQIDEATLLEPYFERITSNESHERM